MTHFVLNEYKHCCRLMKEVFYHSDILHESRLEKKEKGEEAELLSPLCREHIRAVS